MAKKLNYADMAAAIITQLGTPGKPHQRQSLRDPAARGCPRSIQG